MSIDSMRLWYLRAASNASAFGGSHVYDWKGGTTSMQRIRRLSVPLAVAGVPGVAAPAAASALSTITISGATASYPLVSLLANKYVKLHPHKVKFRIAQGGAQVGVNDVAGGRGTVGGVSRG